MSHPRTKLHINSRRNLFANEANAVAIANECKLFIDEIRKLDADSEISEFLKNRYNDLKQKITLILDQINCESYQKKLPEIKNYYYLYCLQQVSRLNHFLSQEIEILDKRESLNNHTSASSWSGYNNLINAGIKAIDHQLLPSSIVMNVTVSRDNVFREAYEESHDVHGHQYFYHERTSEDGEKHQDYAHYQIANTMIGVPTQLSNINGLFKSDTYGQAKHDYYKKANKSLHAFEQALFRSAIRNIQAGNGLTQNEKKVLESGKYYRYNSPVKYKPFNPKELSDIHHPGEGHQITHIGHAAEYIVMENTVPLRLCIDPVHYQSGTGGVIGVGGKILYDRYTDPAFDTDGYPGVNIVLISHNHFDHLCEKTIKEAFTQTNTLFVIPAGDAKYMQEWGITNYIEMGSWNDVLTINLKDKLTGKSSQYEIHAFPANHASCRGVSDFFQSLYMGYMIRDLDKQEIILCTGDTAVIEQDHFEQLQNYLIKNNLSISTACIAHGPDRPRQWMQCSHQSTADAITMHAELNVMNANVLAKQNAISVNDLSFEDLKAAACHAIGYHQGCYRLGLLNLSDVDTTLLRTFAVLHSLGNKPVNEINLKVLQQNVFYRFMDKFEQDGLQHTLQVYQGLTLSDKYLTLAQVVELITSHLNVPQPGYRADFSKDMPYETFKFEYQRLLLNQNPLQNVYNDSIWSPAFEYFCHSLDPAFYTNNFNKIDLTIEILSLYLDRYAFIEIDEDTRNKITIFIHTIHRHRKRISDQQLDIELGKLYSLLFPQKNEEVDTSLTSCLGELADFDHPIRDEGHGYTAFAMLAGLLHFPDFRQHMHDRHQLMKKNEPGFFEKHPLLGYGLIGFGVGVLIAACFCPPIAIYLGVTIGVTIGMGLGVVLFSTLVTPLLGAMMLHCDSQKPKIYKNYIEEQKSLSNNVVHQHLSENPPQYKFVSNRMISLDTNRRTVNDSMIGNLNTNFQPVQNRGYEIDAGRDYTNQYKNEI